MGASSASSYQRRRSNPPRAFQKLRSPLSQRRRRLLVAVSVSTALLAVTLFRRRCQTSCPAPSRVVFFTPPPSPLRRSKPVFSVVVLTHNRHDSLLRLLRSLRNAAYDGARIDLHIWVDRALEPVVDAELDEGGREGGLVSVLATRMRRVAQRVGGRRALPADAGVLTVGEVFEWPHGGKWVHVWERHVGIWGQWVETWRPRRKERAVLLEDDLEVSPQYYRWLRGAAAAYGGRDDVFGYSLQRPTLRANQTGYGRRPLRLPQGEAAFLYPLVGSWGYAPEAQEWRMFRRWFHSASCVRGFRPVVDGLVPSRWYVKQEKKRSMWTMWHIWFAERRRLYTVYAHLAGGKTLAANWREPGLHFHRGADAKKASGITGERDFELLGEEEGMEGEVNGDFEFPDDPVRLAWNGTYVGRDGVRTKL